MQKLSGASPQNFSQTQGVAYKGDIIMLIFKYIIICFARHSLYNMNYMNAQHESYWLENMSRSFVVNNESDLFSGNTVS